MVSLLAVLRGGRELLVRGGASGAALILGSAASARQVAMGKGARARKGGGVPTRADVGRGVGKGIAVPRR